MKHLIKVMLVLGLIFASTFILGRVLGILTVENVRSWLEWAGTIDPVILFALIVALLFLDLFVAIPTMTITLLAGYFLGFPMGMLAALIGMFSAALGGYSLSRSWGDRLIALIVKDEDKREDLTNSFQRSGPAMIMLSRAAPILPEVTACMAGATGMKLSRYGLFWAISTVPYVAIAAYAGSQSTAEDPSPAIYTMIALTALLWLGWFLYSRFAKEGYSSKQTDLRSNLAPEKI